MTITRSEFMDELNRRLVAHDDFRPGIAIVPYPIGATLDVASGYVWVPEGTDEPMRTISQKYNAELRERQLNWFRAAAIWVYGTA